MGIAVVYAKVARVYLREDDRVNGDRLYEVIFRMARNMKLAGATIIQGAAGFGRSAVIHSCRDLSGSDDLPMIIEVIDERKRLMPFVEAVTDLLDVSGTGGCITLENTEVLCTKRVGRDRAGSVRTRNCSPAYAV
jgi:PII-like signaling protein